MKTAISIPDEVFRQADNLARRSKVSRSQLVSDALREYVARHAPDEVTETMDRVIEGLGQPDYAFAVVVGGRVLKRTEW